METSGFGKGGKERIPESAANITETGRKEGEEKRHRSSTMR
jgi:hypothetical protein